MSPEWSKRQAGIGLINFNATDIWFAPGDPINSTAAFHHATHLEKQAYVANRWLFTAIMIVVLIFVLLQVPHSYIRLKAAPSVWYNFRLLRPTPDEIAEKKQAAYSAPPHRIHGKINGPPSRLPHIHWPIPIYRVRGLDLPLSEFLVVFVIWAAGLGVAGWCQASFLTDASRSTLVVMFFVALTAGLGMKAGGIGTWLAYGYTSVNFLHRWTGRLVLLLSTLHVIAYLVVFYKDGGESDTIHLLQDGLKLMIDGCDQLPRWRWQSRQTISAPWLMVVYASWELSRSASSGNDGGSSSSLVIT